MAENNVKKVVLVGIQNSGKTSIALSLKGVKNITRFSGHPTREIGIERFNALGTEFGIFDLGGQDSFRKSHLENFDARIKNADKIIYVIDVQDDKSYDTSLKYMEDSFPRSSSIDRFLMSDSFPVPRRVPGFSL